MKTALFNTNKRSTLAFVMTAFLLIYFQYKDGVPFIMNWDIFGYSSYLPMAFINHSFKLQDLSFFEKVNEIYHNTPTFYTFVTLENGDVITKCTVGWSLVMSPFYVIGHLWAQWGHYPVDGYSWPYQCMMAFGSTFYLLLGLHFLRKILLRFFNDNIASIAFLLIIFATNYLFIQIASVGSTHTLGFCFLSILIWLTIRFHEHPSLKKAVALGTCLALMALIRPPDLLFGLIPLGWNSRNLKGLKEKIQFFFKNHKKELAGVILSALLIFSIQIAYWKYTTGHLLLNSYMNNAGEGFDWFTPYLPEVLFSFRKGWLLYTPIVLFGIIGLFFWRKKEPSHGNFILITFAIFLYVVSSWTTWWYAESFGQRALTDMYPLLAIGFGFFMLRLSSSLHKWIFAGISFILLSFNLFQTWQMTKGILHGSLMTKAYYLSTFGQTSYPTETQKKLLLIDKGTAFYEGFKNEQEYRRCYSKKITFPKNYELNDAVIYTPIIDLLPADLTKKDHIWIRSTWNYKGDYHQLEGKIFTASALYGSKSYGWVGRNTADTLLRIDTLKRTVVFDYLSPDMRTKKDRIRIVIWKQAGPPIQVKSVLIEGFERKQ